jgi:hypothetical protein
VHYLELVGTAVLQSRNLADELLLKRYHLHLTADLQVVLLGLKMNLHHKLTRPLLSLSESFLELPLSLLRR